MCRYVYIYVSTNHSCHYANDTSQDLPSPILAIMLRANPFNYQGSHSVFILNTIY